MAKHKTGTREEWLAARLKLLKAEKEHTRRGDELARQRQELPWVRIEKDYRYETDDGKASLADLFRRRSQLLVYHFMFGPEYTGGCPACSAIADGFNGFAVHLEHHDVAMIAVSRAPIAALSSRRYSVQRHIRNLHRGNGIEVSYVDYMEGRLTGIYNPNPYKQQSSSKYNTYFDPIYGATRLNPSPSNPFMPYSTRSGVYRYPSYYSSSNSYSDRSYKAVKPSSSSSAQQDILT